MLSRSRIVDKPLGIKLYIKSVFVELVETNKPIKIFVKTCVTGAILSFF